MNTEVLRISFGNGRRPDTTLTWDERYPDSYLYRRSESIKRLKQKRKTRWLCEECGHRFNDPHIIHHHDSEQDTEGHYCPKCYSSDIIVVDERKNIRLKGELKDE